MPVVVCNWLWRLLIAGVFITFAWSKARQGINYAPPATIYDRLVAFSPVRHYAILTIEIITGLWVLSSWKPRASAAIAGALLLGFIALLAAEIFKNTPALCGCGAVPVFPDGDPRLDLGMGIIRNLILLAGCIWLWLLGERAAHSR